MCDTEHMLECSGDSGNSNNLSNMHISNSDFDQIVEQFQVIKMYIAITHINSDPRKRVCFRLKLYKFNSSCIVWRGDFHSIKFNQN